MGHWTIFHGDGDAVQIIPARGVSHSYGGLTEDALNGVYETRLEAIEAAISNAEMTLNEARSRVRKLRAKLRREKAKLSRPSPEEK